MNQPASEPANAYVSAEVRRATLDRELQQWARYGWRVETRSEYQATVARGKDVNHVFHLLMSVVTVGLWLIVWALVTAFGGVKRRLITVNDFGEVERQRI